MEMVFRTHVGRVRDHNEDSVVLTRTNDGQILAVVADGMGGHQAGDVASEEATHVIRNELLHSALDIPMEDKKDLLLRATGKANEKVYSLAKEECYKGMGTTVIAAIIHEKEVVLGHVGDSRAYVLRDGSLYQLTVDHSYVEFLKKHGQITKEEALTHPQRNMILRAIGTAKEVEVDLVNTPWQTGDTLLLCTDGLTTMLTEQEIGEVLASTDTLEMQAEKLLQQTLHAGGKDNVSIVLVKNDTA